MKVAPQKSAAQPIRKFAIARDMTSPAYLKSASKIAATTPITSFYRFGMP
jgi:hypothetical protein